MILTFMLDGARAVISFCIRSEIPGYMVVPPDWRALVLSKQIKEHTYHNNVAVQIFSDIDIALHDGVEGCDVNTARFKTKNGWLEESFWRSKALVSDCDDLTVGEFIRFLQAGTLGRSLDFLLEVERNVAELLLDITDNFSFGSGGEGVASLGQNLHQVVSQISASHVDTRDGVRKRETFVDGDNVSDTVTRVKHDTCCSSGGIQGQHSLDGDVEGRRIEGLEDDLCHLFSV